MVRDGGVSDATLRRRRPESEEGKGGRKVNFIIDKRRLEERKTEMVEMDVNDDTKI